TRAFTMAGTRPGSGWGETARMFFLFRGWLTAMAVQHGARTLSRPTIAGRLAYASSLAVTLTVLGALPMQLREISKGRDSLSMTNDPNFWGQAALNGTGLSPFADLLTPYLSESHSSIDEVIGGPFYEDIKTLLTMGRNAAVPDGERRAPTSTEVRRFAEGF